MDIFLRWFNAALALLGGAMALTLGVVCILYAAHLDAAPRMRAEWPLLMISTLMFFLLALAGAAAFQGQRRNTHWKWWAQGSVLAVIGLFAFFVERFLL